MADSSPNDSSPINELMRRFMRAYARADRAALSECLTEDFVWHTHEGSDAPIGKALVGVDAMVDAPVVLVVTVDLGVVASFDKELARVGVISGASIYPFVWNILLAARNRGYGGTITTFAAGAEAEVQKLFDVPPYMAVAAMLPLGRPVKQLTKLRRKPVEEFATIDQVAGEPLRAGV